MKLLSLLPWNKAPSSLPNPLDGMTFSDAGTLGLPVEIWQSIFTCIAPHMLPQIVRSPSFQSDGWPRFDPHPQWRPIEYTVKSLIVQRRKITQVCKAWYFIGLPLLWGEFILNLDQPRRSLLALCKMLSNGHQPATNVVHLILFPMLLYLQPSSKKNLDLFPIILSHLPNVAVISTATLSISSPVKPDAIVIEMKRDYKYKFHAKLILSGAGFWDNCHSLFFDGTISLLQPSLPADVEISLPRLTYLHFGVLLGATAHWVMSSWTTPSIRALSIGGGNAEDCLNLLQRVSSTIEILKVPKDWNASWQSTPSAVIVKGLQSLGLSREDHLHNGIPELEKWFNHIVAPNLRQLTFYIRHWSYIPQGSHFRTQVEAAQTQYPTLQHIIIQCTYHKIFPTPGKDGFITIEDLDYLSSKGLVIYIFVEGKGCFDWFTSEGRQAIEGWMRDN